MTIELNRAQKRALAKPWRVRNILRDIARRDAAEKAKAGTLPRSKRKRPRHHNGYEEADDAGPETGSA